MVYVCRNSGDENTMTPERYKELQYNQDAQLTPEEQAEGWFFCCEWDGMLITKDWREAECCTCIEKDK